MKRIINYLNSKSSTSLEIISYLLLFLTGFIDYISGSEISFSIFYLFPVSIVAWSSGLKRGFFISLISACVWLGADFFAIHSYSNPTIPFWNAFVRLGFFIIVTLLLTSKKSSEEELKRVYDEKEAMEEEFLATVAHDLKNPLASIQGYAYILGKPELADALDNRKESIEVIRLSCDIMLELINNIVESHKFESGKLKFHFEDFSLNDLVDEIGSIFFPQSEINRINLDFFVPDKIFVKADLRMIRRVFYNLMSNAVRYTPEKGTITIRALPSGDRVEIEVRDTGSGIPKTEHEKLFQKFKQAKGTRTGSGLGLYLVKNLLEAHGSNIRMESDTNKGTSFFFSLPMGKEVSIS